MSEVEKFSFKKWNNFHSSVEQIVEEVYVPQNIDKVNYINRYNAMSDKITQIASNSISNGKTIRACGGKWSLSPIAFDRQTIIETDQLNLKWNPSDDDVNFDVVDDAQNLLFAQCGCKIESLNIYLRKMKKSLSTCGASNGQTIAGAISCGTHGAALDFGSIHDSVVGLHIITNENKSFYIQRLTRRVMKESFVQGIQATLIEDDALFYAALVSMGSFGFIHGVMLEVEDWFYLKNYSIDMDVDQANELMTTLDFENSAFQMNDREGVRPYHFKLHFNPYQINQAAKVEILYKEVGPESYQRPKLSDGTTYHKDMMSIIAKISDKLPLVDAVAAHFVINNIFKEEIKGKKALLMDTFGDTSTQGKTYSVGIGIDHKDSVKGIQALREIISANNSIPAIFAVRFVKQSKALMAFTRFPITCVLEIDAVRSDKLIRFTKQIPSKFREKGIPFTFHWGKNNPLDKDMVLEIYGNDFVEWQKQKSKIMNSPESAAWASDYARQLGLDGWIDINKTV